MSAIEAVARAPEHPWRAEIRAMLQLSWPMILTNLGQTAMTATDVLMMGRLGSDALAAGSLGANLYFLPLIFGLGPDERRLADDRDRTRPQKPFRARCAPHGAAGPVDRHHGIAPDLVVPVARRGDPACDATGAEAGGACRFLCAHPACGRCCPSTATSCCAPSSRRWSGLGWALIIVFFAVAFNVFANWCLMYGNLGFPALGLPGSGWATTISSVLMFAGLAGVVIVRTTVPALPPVRPLLARRLAALQGVPEARPADRGAAASSRCRSSTRQPS